MLSLTRIPTIPAEPPVPLPPPPPVHPGHSHTHPEEEEEEDHDDDDKAEDEGESHDDDDDAVGGGSTSFVHGALCTVGILLVLPSGRYPPPSHVTSGLLTTEDADAGRGPAPWLGRRIPRISYAGSDAVHDRRAQQRGVTRGLRLRYLQEELAAQLAGQLRRNVEHFSGALGADQGVLRAVEERVGANLEVMKQVWVRVHDHRGKAPGTTCPTISSVIVVAIAFLIMFFVIRST
ncbi:hypothetical protein EDB84DRAFT_1677660 [Lactarius hengduanensis]|nr:hypothetical protein EDB84DRAFT_1677660 [Lactarius hengduanensis]